MTEKKGQSEEPADTAADANSKPSAPAMISTIAVGVAVVACLLLAYLLLGSGEDEMPVSSASVAVAGAMPQSSPASASVAGMSPQIERRGESQNFYTTIMIPPGAETLYLSGSGAAQKPDGTWGSMEEQAIDTFTKFKEKLENEGWSMSDIVQVRAFAVAGEYGLLDFDGFNRGYRQFFGTEENPQKPVRSFVQVADLVVEGWLVEVEVRAARMPKP